MVISWGAIAYGGVLSALFAVLLVVLMARERRPLVLAVVALGAGGGSVGWNAILRATDAREFFHDAPIPVFPVSYQDTGSAVFALAALGVLLGLVALPTGSGWRVSVLALLGGLGALIADVYTY